MIKYQHFALDNLFLANGYIETHADDGIEREYEREDELEQCIRRLVLRKPEPFRGWDLRFLRRGLELSQVDFGKMLDRDAQTVARWEKSADLVPKFVDLMIRVRFAERFEPQIKLAELLGFTDGTAPALPTFIQLSLTANGWVFDFGTRSTLKPIKVLSIHSATIPTGNGPVQTVSNKMYYSSSDQYETLEEQVKSSSSINLLSFSSHLSMQSTASVKMPVFSQKNIIRGFYNEQEQRKPH